MLDKVQFSLSFRKNCGASSRKYCLVDGERKSLKERINCLAKIMMDSVLSDEAPSLPDTCKATLRNLLKQRHESVNIDTDLKEACEMEISTDCQVEAGKGRVSRFILFIDGNH